MPRDQQHPDHYTMSFGDHLEELRSRLWKSLLLPVPLAAVLYIFSNTLIELLLRPLFRALAEEVSSAYVLAFYPPEEKRRDGKMHTIRVEGPQGLTLRQSRTDYRAAEKQ